MNTNAPFCKKLLSDLHSCGGRQLCNPCNGIRITDRVHNKTSKFYCNSLLYTTYVPPKAIILCTLSYVFALRSGYDCGLYVMAVMDVLSIKTDGLYFKPSDVWHMRDLCLLSNVDGKIAHFPEALQGISLSLHWVNKITYGATHAGLFTLQGRMRMFRSSHLYARKT